MSQPIKVRFSNFLSEIEQTEKEKANLVDMVEKLKKEQAEKWEKFNTDTHVLVEIETLNHIINTLDDTQYDAGRTSDYAEEAATAAEECKYHSEDLETKISDIKDDIKALKDNINDNVNDNVDSLIERDLLIDEVIKSIINRLEIQGDCSIVNDDCGDLIDELTQVKKELESSQSLNKRLQSKLNNVSQTCRQ